MKTIREAWKKDFRKQFVESNIRAMSLNNEVYVVGKAEDVERFIEEKIKEAEAQTLEWVEREVIGKDKDYSDCDKFERNFGEARNGLRARQHQLIKQKELCQSHN